MRPRLLCPCAWLPPPKLYGLAGLHCGSLALGRDGAQAAESNSALPVLSGQPEQVNMPLSLTFLVCEMG